MNFKAVHLYLSSICLVGFVTLACGSPPISGAMEVSGGALREARKLWNTTASSLDQTYTYVRLKSSFTGHTDITVVRFEKGELTARLFKRIQVGVDQGERKVKVLESFLAVPRMKRLFAGEGGFPGLSMEELYDACEREVISKDPKEYHLGVGVHENGALKQCYYSPRNCADDCSTNYGVAFFYDHAVSDEALQEFLKTPTTVLEKK
ncbi:MAG: hypothetical protein KDK33_03775 [Leptospiraceae bacterium]|nr:hypothetical protein [Leptospiraceae bacterium]